MILVNSLLFRVLLEIGIIIRRIEKEKGGVLIIDDAIEEKPYTDENGIICWHFSHAKGRCVKGVNILSCLVRYEDIAFPISFEAVCKDLHFYDLKTKEEKRQSSITKNQRSHIFASIVAYCKLEFLRMRTALNHFALKYKLILKANQMAFQELKKLRESTIPG